MWTRACMIVAFVVGGGLLEACDNPNYCADCPLHDRRNEDMPVPCTSNKQCAATTATPLCDLESMTCVQCTQSNTDSCTGTTPVCGSENTCVQCAKHTDCASSACLPDGACGDSSSVAFVAPTGTDNAQCSNMMPCRTVAAALQLGRPYVKLSGTTFEAVTIDQGRTVKLLADDGAKLTRASGGPIILVKDNNTSLSIYDLTISDAPAGQSGIVAMGGASVSLVRTELLNNPGFGISCDGCSLSVAQSTITSNTGGGIIVQNGTFVIVGNMISGNGSLFVPGGIFINTGQSPVNRLEFNTLNGNIAQGGTGTGIQCTAGAFTARNNIISDNGSTGNLEQVGGGCTHAHSIVRPGALPAGPSNSASDPMFVNMASGNLHLKPDSPALGAADPASDLTGPAARDIDGQLRKAPADIGADEVP
jgi:hypothetical protein